jgi:hypothetical protein
MSTRSRERSDDSSERNPDREVAIFTEALTVPVQARAAFLNGACAGDANLRHKLEALLRAHDRVGNFLEDRPKL